MRTGKGIGWPAREPADAARARARARAGFLTPALMALAAGSGAIDALSFAALGAVFTSVMTGNLVLLGIAVVHTDPGAAARSAVSISSYIAGVLAATWWLRGTRATPEVPWPARISAVLAGVAGAQAAVLVAWLATGARFGDAPRIAMIAVSAAAMGMQSTGVNALAVGGATTTYLTGTLTALITELATTGSPVTMRRRFGVLVSVLCGAALSTVLIIWARPVAAALPFAATLSALAITWRHRG